MKLVKAYAAGLGLLPSSLLDSLHGKPGIGKEGQAFMCPV